MNNWLVIILANIAIGNILGNTRHTKRLFENHENLFHQASTSMSGLIPDAERILGKKLSDSERALYTHLPRMLGSQMYAFMNALAKVPHCLATARHDHSMSATTNVESRIGRVALYGFFSTGSPSNYRLKLARITQEYTETFENLPCQEQDSLLRIFGSPRYAWPTYSVVDIPLGSWAARPFSLIADAARIVVNDHDKDGHLSRAPSHADEYEVAKNVTRIAKALRDEACQGQKPEDCKNAACLEQTMIWKFAQAIEDAYAASANNKGKDC